MRIDFTHRSGFQSAALIGGPDDNLPVTLIHDPRGGDVRVELTEGDGPVTVQTKQPEGTIVEVGVLTRDHRALDLPRH